jgi:predicted MFS family arabinose efflux permease
MLGAAAMTTLGALPVFLLTAQAVLVRQDLEFSEPQLGLAVSAFFGSAALASVSFGSLVERLGRRWGTVIAGVLATLTALAIAVVARSYVVLLVLLVVAGLSNAALQMTSNIAVARSVRPGRQGLAFGVKQSAIPVAILIGGLAVPTVGVVVGWRWTFAAAAVPCFAVVVAGLRMPRSTAPARPRDTTPDRPPRNALLVSFAAMTMASAAVNSLGSFLPQWAFHTGLSPGTAGLLLASGSALSVLARVASGVVADRRRGRNLPVVSTYISLGAVGMLLISLGEVPALVAGTLVAFAIGWAWPGLFLFAVVRVGRDSPATASGAVQAGAFAGGAAGPVLFGLLVAASSYPFAWRTAAAALVVAALLLLVARRMFLGDLVRRPPRRPLDAALPPTGE